MDRKSFKGLVKGMNLTPIEIDVVLSDECAMEEIETLMEDAAFGVRTAVNGALKRHSFCCFAEEKSPF